MEALEKICPAPAVTGTGLSANEIPEAGFIYGSGAAPPSPDYDASISFCRMLYPEGPWVITAIHPESKAVATRTFGPGEEAALRAWLSAHGDHNLYFGVNRPIGRPTKKTALTDIAAVCYLHVDIDPRVGEDPAEERERIAKALAAFTPPPTFIIDSGGGMQGFWRLQEPIPVNGDLAAADDAKLYNLALERALGADRCHNVDRIMRLPGTVNWPDAKKRARGRVPRLARLLLGSGKAYPREDFEKAEAARFLREASPGTPARVNIPANVRRLASVDELPASVPDWAKVVIIEGGDPDNPNRFPSRSEAVFAVACALVRAGVEDEVIYSVLTDPDFRISESALEKPALRAYALRQIASARARAHEEWAPPPSRARAPGSAAAAGSPPPGPALSAATEPAGGEAVVAPPASGMPRIDKRAPVLDAADPASSAQALLLKKWPELKHYNDEYLNYDGAAYVAVPDNTVDAQVWQFLRGAKQRPKEDAEPGPFLPNKAKVANVIAALRAQAHLDHSRVAPPAWLRPRAGLPPSEIIACRNGLLHVPTRELHDPTPAFFTRNAVGFEYAPSPPRPEQWLGFLGEVWPDDPEAITTLQEVMGYLLTVDTSLQKIFLLIGPPRSGKGTIGRVIGKLVGSGNITSPTLNSLGGDFGLQSLIGKQVAIISDMRIDARTQKAAVVEALLRISGEDHVSVNRKNRDFWEGQLSARFLIMSNELPRLSDDSGALTKRYVVLHMRETFYGREDPGLADRLTPELPGIFAWALDGLTRLRERGHFVEPASSAARKAQLHELASPVQSFVAECCDLGPDLVVEKNLLFSAWKDWCSENGDLGSGTKATFGSKLLAAFAGKVRETKPRAEGSRVPSYAGIALRGHTDAPF